MTKRNNFIGVTIGTVLIAALFLFLPQQASNSHAASVTQTPTTSPPVTQNLYPILKDGKWGYIDRAGKVVIQPRFYEVQWFSGGLAQVQIDGKLGYIDRSGSYVWKPMN